MAGDAGGEVVVGIEVIEVGIEGIEMDIEDETRGIRKGVVEGRRGSLRRSLGVGLGGGGDGVVRVGWGMRRRQLLRLCYGLDGLVMSWLGGDTALCWAYWSCVHDG